MTRRPLTPDPAHISGAVNVLKPPGMTSHDMVDALRRLTGVRRIGHTGTLDPGASGVLVLCVGRATRIAEFLSDQPKGYRAEFTFGVETDSGDAYGAVVGGSDASGLTASTLGKALTEFVGAIQQVPPMVSAVRRSGRRLYEHARRGEVVEVAPRQVTVFEIRLLEFVPGPRATALVQVECSKGTYIRALASDLGRRLGVGGHASFVLRTRVGRFTLDSSLTLEELSGAEDLARLLVPPDEALNHLPVVDLTALQRRQVLDGMAIPLFQIPGWASLPADLPIRLRDERGLVAVGRVEAGRLLPSRVLRGTGAR
ncbi:MAG: tRNA pseudouridine(55) synthase TruB [Armatimonadetes bacterium]|nr:tRNA pseudouridine(55) synthase TruB [Armatimonadota bacterium]